MITIQQWLKELTKVTDKELHFIDEITETISVKANEVVIKQGQISNRVGFLAEGAMRSYYTDAKGNEKVVSFAFEGQPLILVGSFISQTPCAITAVTMEPSVIVWTDYERYTSLINKFPKYNTVFIEGLAKWMAEGNERMEYLKQSSAKAKYELMCQIDPKIIQRVSLKYIASYLGITQETLSRIRGKK